MQSVLDEIGDVGQLNKPPNKIPDASVSRWQRFKWWVWGTPQQYWTNLNNADLGGESSNTTKATDNASSSTDLGKGAKKWQRSRWSVADIIASAILRSRITKDEDVARCFLHMSVIPLKLIWSKLGLAEAPGCHILEA